MIRHKRINIFWIEGYEITNNNYCLNLKVVRGNSYYNIDFRWTELDTKNLPISEDDKVLLFNRLRELFGECPFDNTHVKDVLKNIHNNIEF